MNYKIRITADNQAIVKRIADENGMNKYNYLFKNCGQFYIIINNEFDNIFVQNATELTTEQFIELFDKKETELDKWLRETKAKNLSLEELKNYMFSTKTNIDFVELRNSLGLKYGESLSQALLNQWNNQTEESPKVETEPHICKYCQAETTQDDETCYAKPTEWQPKRGDRVLVWDADDLQQQNERIFVGKIKGEKKPIIAVMLGYEELFLSGEKFCTCKYENMKPLPIEQPKETDFKTKVIELIEKRIDDYKTEIEFRSYNRFYAEEANNKIESLKEILAQIKEL
jgi:hypothetical protein